MPHLPPNDNPAPDPVLTVVGPAKGRWRARRHFGPAETRIPVADLTAEEIAAIQADPELLSTIA